MFKAPVDGFGRTIGGVGMIEVGRISPARRLSVLPSVMSSVRPLGTRVEVSVLISAFIRALPQIFFGITIGVDDVLVDAPGDLEGDVPLTGKQVE